MVVSHNQHQGLAVLLLLCAYCCPVWADAPWRFAVFCDTRGNSDSATGINSNGTFEAFAQDIVAQGCELVLVGGDLCYGTIAGNIPSYSNQFANWRAAMGPVYNAGIEVYPVRGTHENLGSSQLDAFRAAFNDPYIPTNGPAGETGLSYSFSFRNALFIGLDEYVTPHRVNQDWLDSQLTNASQYQHVFTYGHEPAFSVAHQDCLADDPTSRDLFWNSLGRAGCRVYFCGHDHFYNRAHATNATGDTIFQALVGSGGAPFYSWTPPYREVERVIGDYHDQANYGYALVTVHDDTALIEWRAWNGIRGTGLRTLDYFVYSCAYPLAGDFDGDGRADAVLAGGGYWYAWLSALGGQQAGPAFWGTELAEIMPLAADFDGDGLADVAVMDATGSWYFWLSSFSYAPTGPVLFGSTGVIPVAADFDGDLKADPALVRTNGDWYIYLSTFDYAVAGPYAYGAIGYAPLAGDFDGDRKADPGAVSAAGLWYLFLSGRNYQLVGPFGFGAAGYLPLAGDFDGDGKADPAAYRRGSWYVWPSSQAYLLAGPFRYCVAGWDFAP